MKTHFAVAVKAGKFQAQSIVYDKRGESTIVPLSGWGTYREALSYAPDGYQPFHGYRQSCVGRHANLS